MWNIDKLLYLLLTHKGDVNLHLTLKHLWVQRPKFYYCTSVSPSFFRENVNSVLQTLAMTIFFYPSESPPEASLGIASTGHTLRGKYRERLRRDERSAWGVCVCFFHFFLTALQVQAFRKEGWNLQRPGPQSSGREGGLAGFLVTHSAPWFTGSRANGEVNSCSVLLVEGAGLLTKMLLLHLNDHIFPPGMSWALCSLRR